MSCSILITGGSTGIGRDLIDRLLPKVSLLFFSVRKQADADAILEAHNQNTKLVPLLMDVTDDEQVQKAALAINEKLKAANHNGLDVLINNAGIATAGPLETLPIDVIEKQIDINFYGMLRVTRALLPALREAKGRIIQISSISGRIVFPMLGPYCISKHAMEAASDALRLELKQFGVHVVLIEPGAIKTPIWQKADKAGSDNYDRIEADMQPLYENMMNAMRKLGKESEEHGLPVSDVSDVVLKAINASKPKARYMIGGQTKMIYRLQHWLPTSWIDKLLLSRLK